VIILKIIKGEYADFSAILTNLKSAFKNAFYPFSKNFALILSLVLILGLLNAIKPDNGQLSDLIFILSYCIIGAILFKYCTNAIDKVSKTAQKLTSQTQQIFPILLGLTSVVGANASVSALSPIFAIVSNGIVSILSQILLPVVSISLIFSLLSSLSQPFGFNKINDFLQDLFKWLIGGIITFFTVFSTIKGLSAGVYDNFSIRALKNAVGNSFPLIGSFAKEGIDLVLTSGILIKNAIGNIGIIFIFYTILTPLLEIIFLSLSLKLLAGLCEPLCDKRISQLLTSFSKTITMLSSLLFMLFLIYFITFMLVITAQGALIA
ncbi:MAG: hypothetical protein IKT32_07140, partial [Clostridia bacterium]|nr:hypothetical protein [Clostridia bacterium]